MKFTGRLKEPIRDFKTDRLTILFEPHEDFRQCYEELKDYPKLSLEIDKYHAKRSLKSNDYYWTLLSKFAKVLHLSNPEAHNRMLCNYGVDEVIDGKRVLMPIPDTEEAARTARNAHEYHIKPTSEVKTGKDGVVYRTYKLLRGSRTYNTSEMARLIDGLISECKEAGIPDSEIATPNEKRLLKERYGVDIG